VLAMAVRDAAVLGCAYLTAERGAAGSDERRVADGGADGGTI